MDSLRSGLIEEYVLDLCTEEERRSVEAAAAADPKLAAMIEEIQSSLHQYCREHTKKPPAELKPKILQVVKEETVAQSADSDLEVRMRKLRNQRAWLTAACVSLLLAAGLLANRGQSLKAEAIALEKEYTRAITDRQLLSSENDQLRSRFEFLHHEATMQIRLTGTAHAPESEALVYWNPISKDAVLKLVHLPTPPANKTYQLWADVEGEMLNMGVVAGEGGWISLPFIEHAESLNLTLEDAQGSEHPNVDQIYIRGSI